jgi:hypothetical protein
MIVQNRDLTPVLRTLELLGRSSLPITYFWGEETQDAGKLHGQGRWGGVRTSDAGARDGPANVIITSYRTGLLTSYLSYLLNLQQAVLASVGVVETQTPSP